MSAGLDLGALFNSGTTGAGYPGGEGDEDEEAGGLTELVKFSPERIDGVADPASGFPVLLIKALPQPAVGRPVSRPVPAASVKAARKAARRLAKAEAVRREQAAAQVRRALREVVADELGDLRARAAAVRRRIEDIEVQRGVRPAASQEVSTESWAVKGGVDEKLCGACGKTSRSLGAGRAAHEFCSQCGHRHDDAVSKGVAPSGAGEGLAAVLRKATAGADSNERAEAIAKLTEQVGREVTTMVLTGAMTPAQFTRAFLSQGRAPLSAPQGSSGPRIPQARAISSDDFARPPVAPLPGRQRANPLDALQGLAQAGQAAAYGGGGIASADPYAPAAGAPNSTTMWPALAAARSVFGNAPMPGAARPR